MPPSFSVAELDGAPRGREDGLIVATRAQLERQLAAHRRAAATHRRAELVHGAAAMQAAEFGDEARELRERRLEAAQADHARTEDERASCVVRELSALQS
jgi:hypothetical protein